MTPAWLRGPYRAGPWPGLTPAGAGVLLGCALLLAGGQLIVAPNFDADVVRAAKASGLVALPGVMTPSEGFAALKSGADGLKLFPAEIIPPAVFKAWRAVFPALPGSTSMGCNRGDARG